MPGIADSWLFHAHFEFSGKRGIPCCTFSVTVAGNCGIFSPVTMGVMRHWLRRVRLQQLDPILGIFALHCDIHRAGKLIIAHAEHIRQSVRELIMEYFHIFVRGKAAEGSKHRSARHLTSENICRNFPF